MFRYIALSWPHRSELQSRLASSIEASLRHADGWQRVLAAEGLHVYAAGCTSGANQPYALPLDQGVVLGRLFRRRAGSEDVDRDLVIRLDEGADIIKSGGQALIDCFWGRWIAFLPSPMGGHGVLRDPTGALPCFQMQIDGVVITFSWLEDVLKLGQVSVPAVNWEAVAATLVFRQLGGRETALDGVTQVLAGQFASLQTSNENSRMLWRAAEVARSPADLEPGRAAGLLRETTTRCVRAWMSCYDDIVLRLSGGVDSAILLGSLFVNPPTANVACLNYHSPGSDSDEREYARLAAARACCRLFERHRDDDFQLREVRRPARTPVPGSHIGRMGSDRMDAEVTDAVGAPVLFTGAGGDQLFQEVRSTWPAADYLQLRGLDAGFARAVLDAARLGHVSFWRALQLAFRERLAKRDPLEGIGRNATLIPREVVLGALSQAHRFVHPDLLAATDLPIGKLFHLSALICPFDYYNPYAPEASPELVHPLMSQPLQELCLALPTYVLTRGGRGRALAREAFADRIPPEIASRRSKGGTEEHVTAVLHRSLPLARSVLMDGQLVGRGLLDRERVHLALSGRPTAHGTYVTEAHSCFAVEAWLGQMHTGDGSAGA